MTDYEPDLTILQQLLCMTYFCILLIFTLVSIEKSVRFKPKHIHISFIRIPTALSIYRSLSLSHLYLLMLLSRAIMCMSTSFLQKNTSMYLLIHFLDFIFYHVKVQNIKTWKTAKKRCDFKWISKLSWGEKVPLNYHGVYRLVVSKLSWGFTFCSFSIKNLSL